MMKQKNSSLLSLFNTITQLGTVAGNQTLKERKRIALFNTSCLVWYGIAFIIIFGYFLNDPINYKNITVHVSLIFGIVLAQILHTKQLYTIGRFLFLFLLISIGVLFGNYFRPGSFIEFYILLVPGIGLVYFDNKYTNGFIFIISVLCFALPNIYFQNYPNVNLYQPSVLCLFLSVYMLVNYFKKLNEKNEKLVALERDKVLSDKIILEKQEAELRALNQFKTHFFVNLSHEIRTPITLIKGYASKIDFNSSKKENEYKLNVVNHQIGQIENILNSILDLSKLDENKLKLNTSKVPIVSFLHKHYAEFKTLFDKKNVDFNIEANVDNIRVIMDNRLLSKAINNLLNNALKFTKEDGKVTLKVFEDNALFLQITDDGIGIPESDLTRIFERFYQSENEITKSQGSGIGLSFTKSILEAHGFGITVKSKPNTKTVFTITIPKEYVIREDVVETLPPLIKNNIYDLPFVENRARPQSETILIVDDHHELRHYLRTVLQSYNILEAENGVKALEILDNNTVDMVLTDYMMPKMDGRELVVEIKRRQLKIPVLILTARVDDLAKLDMLRIGVDNYMIKPFIEEELLLSIKNALQTYKNILSFQKQLSQEEKKELDKVETNFHKNIRQIIEDNLANFSFGVEDIASYFTISKRTLNRRVKSILGQTAQELIIQARIEKARKLQLTDPEMSKKEIAKKVGISNASYLFKKLTEHYGNVYAEKS